MNSHWLWLQSTLGTNSLVVMRIATWLFKPLTAKRFSISFSMFLSSILQEKEWVLSSKTIKVRSRLSPKEQTPSLLRDFLKMQRTLKFKRRRMRFLKTMQRMDSERSWLQKERYHKLNMTDGKMNTLMLAVLLLIETNKKIWLQRRSKRISNLLALLPLKISSKKT